MRRRTFAVVAVSLGFAVACTAGTGAPRPAPTDQREPTGSSPEPSGPGQEPAGSPTDEPSGTGQPSPVGTTKPPSGGACPTCSGTYTCTTNNGISVPESASMTNGVCLFAGNISAYCVDGLIYFSNGQDGGFTGVPWTPLAGGGFVVGDSNASITCVPGSSATPGSGGSTFDAG